MATEFNAGSFLGRWIFALALVLGTYNPTSGAISTWATAERHNLRADRRHRGAGPFNLLDHIHSCHFHVWAGWALRWAALFGCVVWLMVDQGWLSLESEDYRLGGTDHTLTDSRGGYVLVTYRARLSGQFDVDERTTDQAALSNCRRTFSPNSSAITSAIHAHPCAQA